MIKKERKVKNILVWVLTFAIVLFTLIGYLDGRADKEKSKIKESIIE